MRDIKNTNKVFLWVVVFLLVVALVILSTLVILLTIVAVVFLLIAFSIWRSQSSQFATDLLSGLDVVAWAVTSQNVLPAAVRTKWGRRTSPKQGWAVPTIMPNLVTSPAVGQARDVAYHTVLGDMSFCLATYVAGGYRTVRTVMAPFLAFSAPCSWALVAPVSDVLAQGTK